MPSSSDRTAATPGLAWLAFAALTVGSALTIVLVVFAQ